MGDLMTDSETLNKKVHIQILQGKFNIILYKHYVQITYSTD